jgi:DMSO/TMAO reductase YedYZ molybdopterin-dependent catalytic subunit
VALFVFSVPRLLHSCCAKILSAVISPPTSQVARRHWLKSALVASGSVWFGLDPVSVAAVTFAQTRDVPDGEFLGILPFCKEGNVPTETLLGEGLDARLYTDLSKLMPDPSRPTPTLRFYIRTRASSLLDSNDLKFINLFSLTNSTPLRLTVESLQKQARAMGMHLLECAGNTREARFGLMSVGEWSGVPLVEVLDRLGTTRAATRILVSGFDRYASPSATSQPGASWIFLRDHIVSSGAFLATEMNGRPLPKDHGAPVRLVVPGWYGCTCIKWVNEIRIVADGAAPTSQMQEFALRTHQQGSPGLARDYQPAEIDLAAMPVRIEKWRVARKIQYRVIGIVWGGSQPVRQLDIRFNPEENYVPVQNLHSTTNDPWTFWTHTWSPDSPGSYLIRLRIAEPSVRTRRLDMGFYARQVEISET